MLIPVRSAALVMAALTASSVAPAQMVQQNPVLVGEPLIAASSTTVPIRVEPAILLNDTLSQPAQSDDLAPQPEVQDEELTAGASLNETVAKLRSTEAGSREMECLAGAIYFESKSESLQGQLAVGHVIANRSHSGKYPSTYCGVVYQRGQFSFVRGRSMPGIARGSMQWKNAVAMAKIVDAKLHASPVGKALSFHARRVSPGWRMTRVATLGNHVFYR